MSRRARPTPVPPSRRAPPSRAARLLLLSLLLSPALAGCLAGPEQVRASQTAYNEAVRRGADEQLLLNLVRLRYRDAPLFLQAGSVVAQFGVESTVGVDRTESDLKNDASGLDLAVKFTEKPTVAFTPLQDDEFVQRMLRPMDLGVIALLQRSGWSLARVLRLCVQQVNGLDNGARASGPTPRGALDLEDFDGLVRDLRALQLRGEVALGYEPRAGDVVPLDFDEQRVSVADALALSEAGYAFEANGSGGAGRLRRSGTALVLRLSDAGRASVEGRRVVERLGLHPERDSWDVRAGAVGFADDLAPAGERDAVVVDTRSFLGALFFLSQAVEVPDDHADDGLVTVTRDGSGAPFDWFEATGRLLAVSASWLEPGSAAVAVPYRGHWFAVADDDLESKSTFALLQTLFALQAGVDAAGSPVLTLSVDS